MTSTKLMTLMNLYDRELELCDNQRINMYCQIIEELENDEIFDTILFDVIASLRSFHADLQLQRRGGSGSKGRAEYDSLEHFNQKFAKILGKFEINQNHIYNDSQNVHGFVHSTITVAKTIMNKYPAIYQRPLTLDGCNNFNSFFEVIENTTVNGIKASDIFASIYYYIINHKHKKEMIKRLIEEIHESNGTCAVGHVTRMINSLRGFQDEFCTKLDKYESEKAIMFHKINKEINACDLFSLDSFEILINSGKISFPDDLQTTLRILKDYSKTEWFTSLGVEGIVFKTTINKLPAKRAA